MNLLERVILCLCGSPWEPGKVRVGLKNWVEARKHRLTRALEIKQNGVWTEVDPESSAYHFIPFGQDK